MTETESRTNESTDSYPEPTIFDVVEAPGGTCEMWSGSRPSPCDNPADYLFVYEGNWRPDDDTRKNAFACEECFRPPASLSENDGGRDS